MPQQIVVPVSALQDLITQWRTKAERMEREREMDTYWTLKACADALEARLPR